MAVQLDPITLDTAAAILGGEQPLSRKTVERMIAAGLLGDYGRGSARRVFRRDVEVLMERFSKGEVTWPPKDDAMKALSTSTPKVQESGLRKKPSRESSSGVVQIVDRPPKRS